jgi:hypothetical protein
MTHRLVHGYGRGKRGRNREGFVVESKIDNCMFARNDYFQLVLFFSLLSSLFLLLFGVLVV